MEKHTTVCEIAAISGERDKSHSRVQCGRIKECSFQSVYKIDVFAF